MGGQCKCKRHVSGRQCNQCQHGFYGLQSALADGCRACNCNAAGTERPDITCHQDSGQCQCKANVIGRYQTALHLLSHPSLSLSSSLLISVFVKNTVRLLLASDSLKNRSRTVGSINGLQLKYSVIYIQFLLLSFLSFLLFFCLSFT